MYALKSTTADNDLQKEKEGNKEQNRKTALYDRIT